MFADIYKKIVIDFSKVTLLFLIILITFSLYQAKNFNLDASSDALLLEGDPDLKYLREVNQTYGSKDFLVLTYSPISSFVEKETILNLQLLKSKIEKLTWVDSVTTIIDVPLLKSTDESLMERLKNYKTLAYPEIDRKRGFDEIINSPIYKNYVISEDGKTSGIVVYLKKDERLAEYIKIKDKYFKLRENHVSKTITAHMDRDCNSYIHPYEPRGLSPREAARIQSFPDDYVFMGPKNSWYTQIGNAVPPLLGKNIGETLIKYMS